MEKEFIVQSSDNITTYVVRLSLNSSRLYIHCGCPAGVLNKWCKHKMLLASGDTSQILGVSDSRGITIALDWIRNSELSHLLAEVKLAENELKEAKMRADKAKKAIEKAMHKGIAYYSELAK